MIPKEPKFSKENYRSPLPKTDKQGVIPTRDHIKPFAGLPASNCPKPIKDFQKK